MHTREEASGCRVCDGSGVQRDAGPPLRTAAPLPGTRGMAWGHSLVLAHPGCVSGRVTYAIWDPGFRLQTGLDSQGCCEDARRQYLGVLSPALGRNAHVPMSLSPPGAATGSRQPFSLPPGVRPHPGFGQRDRVNLTKAEAWKCVSAFLLPLSGHVSRAQRMAGPAQPSPGRTRATRPLPS